MHTEVPSLTASCSCFTAAGSVPSPCRKRLRGTREGRRRHMRGRVVEGGRQHTEGGGWEGTVEGR